MRLQHIQADDSHWAFDLRDGSHYEVNETAFRILEVLQEGADRTGLVDELAREFDVGRAELETDVDDALAQLDEKGLVEREESP